MGVIDHANPLLPLQVGDLLMERFHFRPVYFRAKMMFGMVTVIEKEPVIELAVAAHAPGDGFVGIAAILPEITVQKAEAMAKIEEWQEVKHNVAPVKEEHHKKHGRKRRQLDVSPHKFAAPAFAQLSANRRRIITKET